MEVLLIHHADPNYGKDMMTENGRRQAESLALSLKHRGLDDLYVSPLGRAQETCRYIAEALKITPVTLDWLREIRLDVDLGYPPWDFPGYDRLSSDHLPFPNRWWQEFETGEVLRSHYLKIAQGFDKLMEDYNYEKFKNLYKVERPNEKTVRSALRG